MNRRLLQLLVATPASLFLFGAGCGERTGSKKGEAHVPFEYTNIVLGGEQAWIVATTNGVNLTLLSDRVTVGLGTMAEATLWFDAHKGVFANVLLYNSDSEGKWQWVRDQNADGLPETRKRRGSQYSDAFLDGVWVPFRPGDGTYAIAMTGTQEFRIRHDGVRWQKLPEGTERER